MVLRWLKKSDVIRFLQVELLKTVKLTAETTIFNLKIKKPIERKY